MRHKNAMRVILVIEKSNNEYWVTVDSLPGCYAIGSTIEEAIINAKLAIAEHISGLKEMDETIPEMFKEEKPFLLKTLNSLRKKKIIPKVGEMLYGNDNVYYIKSICYYETHCCFWVDEDEHRSKNNA